MSTLSATSNKPLFDHFFNTSLDDLLTEQQRVNAEDKVLQLFQRCVLEVPAYRQFLAAKQINSADISDYASFIHLPLMNKADYMQAYPLPDRCFGGSLKGADRIAVSSGSTGKPTFWPRSAAYELDIAVRFEQVFRDSFQAHNRNTLAIVCFALGNWVGWFIYHLLLLASGTQRLSADGRNPG
jgi:phenylacetate-CoA ligase